MAPHGPVEPPDFKVLFEAVPAFYLVLSPNPPVFTIVAVSNAYLMATKTKRDQVIGDGLFQVFPDNPNDPAATGVENLRASLLEVLFRKAPHTMPVQKYDIPKPEAEGGGFEQRYWSPVNSPVLNEAGEITAIIHHVEDVTEFLHSKQAAAEQDRVTDSLRLQADQREAELVLRDRLLSDARHLLAEREQAERKLAERVSLAALGFDVGVALTQTQDLSVALQLCAAGIVRNLDAAFARIWTLNEKENVLELKASAGLYTHLNGPHSRIAVGAFKIGLIAQEKAPHLTNNVLNDPRVGDRNWARREGMVAFAGYPLVVEERVVGVVAMFSRRPLSQSTLDVLGSVSDSIAIGIERKRAEEALTKQAEELARSNADLQQFAYITVHDLQEPLRTMISFSQLMQLRYQGKIDEGADKCLGYIAEGATRMKGMIDSMLTYSRVVNVETMPFRPIELETALRWAMLNLQTIIDENQATIHPLPLPTVVGDQVQLVQLFQNLISNAIKYGRGDKAPSIHIAAVQSAAEWIISVRDEGPGLDPRYSEQIFGIFKRLHGREIPGSGMGLSICRRIVDRHGGRIWVESKLGEGATFRFTLPISRD